MIQNLVLLEEPDSLLTSQKQCQVFIYQMRQFNRVGQVQADSRPILSAAGEEKNVIVSFALELRVLVPSKKRAEIKCAAHFSI